MRTKMDDKIENVNEAMRECFGEEAIQICPTLAGLQVRDGNWCFMDADSDVIDNMISMLGMLKEEMVKNGFYQRDGKTVLIW